MHATTVAIDLAKSVFQIAIADDSWKVVAQERLTRGQFERWFQNRAVGLVVMEACGLAHHWGRWFNRLGIPVKLLPAAYIRAYVKRNKTDAADACALLEAARCADIVPVQVKSLEQQALQGLHRTWRRHFSGRGTLDSVPPWVLPARARPLPIVPTALYRGTGEASTLRATPVLWRARAPDQYRYIQALVGSATEVRVGGLCQAAICRSRGSAGLPIALYTPRGDLEPTAGGHGRNRRDLPLEGLPGQRTYPAQDDDTWAGRVHAPLPAACAAHWLSPHPPLWAAGQRRATGESSQGEAFAEHIPA